ncbi:MAG: hypothetical protein ACOX6T_10320 [Myxococcales bacterium]|jgi:hypothetical protein
MTETMRALVYARSQENRLGPSRSIVDSISRHSVVDPRSFETWHVSKNLLEWREPGVHDVVGEVILE